jgi:glutamine amidotransferase
MHRKLPRGEIWVEQVMSVIAIIDYGVGNLRSVQKALEYVGAEVVVTKDPAVIESANGIVLPGVGAFKSGVKQLMPLKQVIYKEVELGKPLLGICLGMQMLFTESEEGGLTRGLDLIPGRIVKFNCSGLKIPHMGWNKLNIKLEMGKKHAFLEGLKDPYVYFVHSYHALSSEKFILATAFYGIEFTAIAARDNIIGTQFHPEKSSAAGLKMLKNFVKMCH